MKCESTSKLKLMSCFSETSLNDFKVVRREPVSYASRDHSNIVAFPRMLGYFLSLCLQIKVTKAQRR